MREAVPLKARCSRKLAVPLVYSLSARAPASIQRPTEAVWAEGKVSEATVTPLGSEVVLVLGYWASKVETEARPRRKAAEAPLAGMRAADIRRRADMVTRRAGGVVRVRNVGMMEE